MYKTNSVMKAAASAAAKVDSMLIAKGKLRMEGPKLGLLPTPGKPNDLFTTELEINDTPLSARNLLTKGQTQEEISQCSGAAISTRGRYMSQNERTQNPNDRALYLFIQGPTKQSLDLAIQKIDDIIKGEQNQNNQRSISRHKPQLPPLMSIQTNVTSVDKVMVGLDHAPPAFDLRNRIIGQGGTNLEYIRNETGAVVSLRGRGSMFIDAALGMESPEPMHLFIEHPRYDGVVAARQLALNLMETMQQELAQFLQMNPPNMANIQSLPVSPGPGHQALVQTPQQMFGQIHQPMGIPPPMLSGPPPVQHAQLQHGMINQHNIITQQPAALQVQPGLNIIQPGLQSNVIQAPGMIQQQHVQQPLLVQQSPGGGMVLNSVPQNTQPAQLNLPPPGVHIPTQQGPLVPSNNQQAQPQQHLLLSQPPPALNMPPPNMPPPSQGLIIVSSAPSQYTQHAQMFVSQAAHLNAGPGLNQQVNQAPYQYHIIQGSNPIYATPAQQAANAAGGIVTGHINELKTNQIPGQHFQTMTVQQVYQQPVLSGQEQIVTQALPPGQQYIVTPNSGPIYIMPPPNQGVQAQPNHTIETISVQSHHHIIPNTVQSHQHHQAAAPPIMTSQSLSVADNGHVMQTAQICQSEQLQPNNEKESSSPKRSPSKEDNAAAPPGPENGQNSDFNEGGNQSNGSPAYTSQSERPQSTDTVTQAQNQFQNAPNNSTNGHPSMNIHNHPPNSQSEAHLVQQPPPQQQQQQFLQQQQQQQPMFQNPPQMVPHPHNTQQPPNFPLQQQINQQILAKPPFQPANQMQQQQQQQQNWLQAQQQPAAAAGWLQNANQVLSQTPPNFGAVQYQQQQHALQIQQHQQQQQLNQQNMAAQQPQTSQAQQAQVFNVDFAEQFNQAQNPLNGYTGVQNNLEQISMQAPSRNLQLPPRPRVGQKRRLNDDNWRMKQGVGNPGMGGPNARFQSTLPPSGRLSQPNNVNNRPQLPKGDQEADAGPLNEMNQQPLGFHGDANQEAFQNQLMSQLGENRAGFEQQFPGGAYPGGNVVGRSRLPPPPPPPPQRPGGGAHVSYPGPNWHPQEAGPPFGQQWMG